MLWTIVTWIILGALAGWIASLITGMDNVVNGWVNVAVGIIGAVIGGLILQLLGYQAPGGLNLGSLLTAILGAVILLGAARMFQRETL